MRFTVALSLGGLLLAAGALTTPTEPVQVLTDAEARSNPEFAFDAEYDIASNGGKGGKGGKGGSQLRCKVFPGDREWPSDKLFEKLGRQSAGGIVKPDPLAKVCYAGSAFNAAQCKTVSDSWADPYLHSDHPSSVMNPLFTGLACIPSADPALGTCSLGGYPVYVLNALNARDVQLAVNFARNQNIRLVVKNTGHDFSGKSSGAGSLSVRTHAMKSVEFIKKYGKDGWNGAAFKVGAGVQVLEIYQAASKHGVVVVGGEAESVGFTGGYVQGGGHSPLSSILGMAADHILSFDVVLASGRIVTASAKSNPDLFWAIRGGGGSTFGVVTSATVKAFPDFPCTKSSFTFTSSPRDLANPNTLENADFWAVFEEYVKNMKSHTDAGAYAYFNIIPMGPAPNQLTFSMASFFAPKKTAEETMAMLKPVFDKAAKLNITVNNLDTQYHTSFYPAWRAGFPKERVGGWNAQPASRLFPKRLWTDSSSVSKLFSAIREVVSVPGGMFIGIKFQAALQDAKVTNAVNPAFRETVLHGITFTGWPAELRDLAAIREAQKTFSEVTMKKWRDVAPESGSYLNEADVNEPNWQQSFYGGGKRYQRLLEVKKQYDPKGVFFAETAVGSEEWSAGVDRIGRLCPVGGKGGKF